MGPVLVDSWRLAVGTLTALPVRPPREVDRRHAGLAMLLAPLATLPLALAVLVVVVLGRAAGLDPLVVALLAIGAVVLGNRAFHLDGLSDVADGLAASYDRKRSLAVMKTGTSGPAGTVAIVLVLGLQVAGLAALLSDAGQGSWAAAVRAAALAAVAVCASRAALSICCLRGVRPARADGLGRIYTQTVAPWAAAAVWIVAALLLALAGRWAGLAWWRGALAVGVALLVVGLVVGRALRRFGGVTGDVFGAAVESALAAVLVVLS
ncbi:adenosylcobinamide-GDP ribazoletransferase [Nocardioides sp. AN3]